jgi:hypothetical protein
MRKGLKSVGSRLTSDMGLDMDGFKLAVGLGGSDLAGVSLFTMPALDFTSTAKVGRYAAPGGGCWPQIPYLCLIIAQLAILKSFDFNAQAYKELFPANAQAS